MDQWRDRELAGGAAEHAEALGETDRGREVARRKSMGGKIDGAGEGKGRAGALEQSAGIGCRGAAEAEQHRADGNKAYPGGNDEFRAIAVEACSGQDREGRIGVIIEADQRAHAQRR